MKLSLLLTCAVLVWLALGHLIHRAEGKYRALSYRRTSAARQRRGDYR